MSRFYEAGPLAQVAINLFYGYGYNFYREENQLRADDQRVRQMVCTLLGRARAGLDAAESRYRRDNIAPPTLNLDHPSVETPINLVPKVPLKKEINVALSNSFGFGGTNASLIFRKVA